MYAKSSQLVFMPATNDSLNTIFDYKNLFSVEECEKIMALGKAQAEREGRLDPTIDQSDLPPARSSKVTWFHLEENNKWIFERVKALVELVNEHYKFEISGMYEAIQFSRYEKGDYYHWHQDLGPGTYSIRKISVVIHLSEPGQFEGGELQTMQSGQPAACQWEQGSATIMPAYEAHRVTEMLSGERYSLVCWVSGPCFK